MRRRVAVAVAAGVVLAAVVTGRLVLAGGVQTTSESASSPMAVPGTAGDYGGAPGRAATEPAPAVPGADTGTAKGDVPAAPTTTDPIGREVVRTAQLTLEAADPTVAARSVRTTVAAAGGVVAEEQVDTSGAWLVVRVPVAGLDRFVDDLAATGTVVSRSARAEDATAQIADIDGRVATQQASVARVRALLAQATSIGDVVAIESELAQREADLESLQRRVAALRDRVALSTVTVELRSATAPTPTGSTPGFGTGLSAGWEGVQTIGRAVAVALGFLLPFLPVLAVAAAVVVWVVRRRRRGGPGQEGGV